MFKEINKDESCKCLEKAEQYIQNKQFELAEKFILKSIRLFPMSKADGKFSILTFTLYFNTFILSILY